MESDHIKCEQSKFILFSSVPCTLNSVGFHENILNAIDSRQQEAVCELCLQRLANQRGAPHTIHGQHLSKIEKISVLPILTYSDFNDLCIWNSSVDLLYYLCEYLISSVLAMK